jgi:hypothetical protein
VQGAPIKELKKMVYCDELQVVDESCKGGAMMFFCGMLGTCPYATHPGVQCLLNHDSTGYRTVTEKDIALLIKLASKE